MYVEMMLINERVIVKMEDRIKKRGNQLIVYVPKELDLSLIHISRVNGMLNNERFISKAPESKVQEEREKLERYTNMMEQVKERLAQLQ